MIRSSWMGLVPACVVVPAIGQTCTPAWSGGFTASTPPGGPRAMEVLDHPNGPSLYIGTVSGSDDEAWLARFDGNSLHLVDRVVGELVPGGERGVFAITSFDAGAGPEVYVGGDFIGAGGIPANGVARFGQGGWSALADGVDATVRALVGYDDGAGPALYAAGYFTRAGSKNASRLARWHGSAWAPLGTGLTGGSPTFPNTAPAGLSLAVFDAGTGPRLYVGGTFDRADGVPAANIASYGPDGWSAVAEGLSGASGTSVLALHVSDFEGSPRLYAGGQFSSSGTTTLANVARWNGASWSPVGTGIPGGNISINSIATHTIDTVRTLVAGGYLTFSAGGNYDLIYRYNGTAWISLGQVTSGPIRTVRSFGSHVYAGGSFYIIGGVYISTLARWDGAWSPVPHTGTLSEVERLRVVNDGTGPALYMLPGNEIAGLSGAGPARFDGTTWSFLPTTGLHSTSMRDVAWLDDGSGPMLYGCGSNLFSVPPNSGRVGRLNNGVWELVGNATQPLFNNSASVLKAHDDGAGHVLFAGGNFTYGVRAWDGATWTTPGGGLPASVGSDVRDLEVFDDGRGPTVWAASTGGLSRWNTVSWEPVQLPVPFRPLACMAFDDGNGPALYLGGNDGILRYDGDVWSVVLHSEAARIWTLAGFDDGGGFALYAGGDFTSLGGFPVKRLGRLSGGVWSTVGGGLDGSCEALAAYEGSLWAGGSFLAAGSVSSENIARWVGCPACYPDCNRSGALSIEDFECFQNRFVAGEPYADCTGEGVLTISDFGCFQSRFIAGCP